MIAVFVGIAGAIATFLAFCFGSYIGFEQGKKSTLQDTSCAALGHLVVTTGPTKPGNYPCQRCGKLVEVGK